MRKIFCTAFDLDLERRGPAITELDYNEISEPSDLSDLPDSLLLETDATDIPPDYDYAIMLNPNLLPLVDTGTLSAKKFFVLDNKTLQRTDKSCWIILGNSEFLSEQADRIVDYYYEQACARIRMRDYVAAQEFLVCAMRAQPTTTNVPMALLALEKQRCSDEPLEKYIDYMCSWIKGAKEFKDKSTQEIMEASENLLKQISGD